MNLGVDIVKMYFSMSMLKKQYIIPRFRQCTAADWRHNIKKLHFGDFQVICTAVLFPRKRNYFPPNSAYATIKKVEKNKLCLMFWLKFEGEGLTFSEIPDFEARLRSLPSTL